MSKTNICLIRINTHYLMSALCLLCFASIPAFTQKKAENNKTSDQRSELNLESSEQKQIEIVYLVWKPNNRKLILRKDDWSKPRLTAKHTAEELAELERSGLFSRPKSITAKELTILQRLGLKGELKIAGETSGGSSGLNETPGSKTRLIIIMQRQLDETVEFPLPLKSRLIVIQMKDKWVTVPSLVPISGDKIRLEASTESQTMLFIREKDGGKWGETAFNWRKD